MVIPVIPDNPPPNWSRLSPTGLIPAMQDGDYTLADSNAICLYMERKQPTPAVLPSDAKAYGRTLWFDAYAGGTIFRHVVHPLFHQTIVAPNIRKVPSDKAVIDNVLDKVQPKIFGYLEFADRRQIPGRQRDDARRHRHRLELHHLPIYRLQDGRARRIQNSARNIRGIAGQDAFRKALEDEKPFVANMGLDRSFLD